jgi:hypothetical protein
MTPMALTPGGVLSAMIVSKVFAGYDRYCLLLNAIYGSSNRYTNFKILIKKRFLTATTQRMNRFCT